MGPTIRRYLATPARALFGSSVIPVYSETYLIAHPSASHIPPARQLGPCLRLDMTRTCTVHCAIVLPAQTTEESGGP
jgi:hypothetical protein